MIINRSTARGVAALVFCLILSTASMGVGGLTEADLKARITEASKDFKDITMVGKALDLNRKALEKVEAKYAELYEIRTTNVALKMPDKLRMEGRLGAVKFEYVINGGKKVIRVPSIKMTKREDYTNDPAKLQDALDIGLVTPSLWQYRQMEIVEDPEAAAAGEIKLALRWPKGGMINYVWIDAENLWLRKLEKRDEGNNLKLRVVYSEPRKVGGVIWMPTKAKSMRRTARKP